VRVHDEPYDHQHGAGHEQAHADVALRTVEVIADPIEERVDAAAR